MATISEARAPANTNTVAESPVRARQGSLGIVTGPVARTLYALPFAVFGVNHFIATEQIASMVPRWLGPSAFWAYFTGAAMIAAAVAIASGRLIVPAAVGLASMLAVLILTIHVPGMMNEETMTMSLVNGLKDFALAGAALMSIRAVGHEPASSADVATF